MGSMESLPPEILHLILHPDHFFLPWRAPVKDYTTLRLVSQTFAAIVTPHVFKHLRLESTECSLERLENVAESKHLRKLVKSYSYTLLMSRLPPPRTAHDDYLRLAAEPGGAELLDVIRSCKDPDPDIERVTQDPRMINIFQWIKKREFELSNDLHEVHVKQLTSLPNLTAISVGGLSEVPHDMINVSGPGRPWGPDVFRAILLAMYNRTQKPHITPVRDLTIEGISEGCMFLPPALVAKAVTAMAGVKTLRFSIRTVRETVEITTPGWVLLIGHLIQSVDSLESLEIEVQESATELYFRPLVTPYKHYFTSKPGPPPPPPPPPPLHWPNLKKLILNDLVFTESHILNFIVSHHKTLTYLVFSNCRLRPDTEASKPDTDDDPPAVRINPWHTVFRAIHTHFAPKTTVALEYFYIRELWFEHPRQHRMHDCETTHWTNYLTGKLETEPEGTPGGHADWCADCDDDERGFDDGMSSESDEGYFFGGPPFGFGYWGDEEEDFDELEEEEEEIDEDEIDEMDLNLSVGMHPAMPFMGPGFGL